MKRFLFFLLFVISGQLYGQVFETSVDVGFNLSSVSIISCYDGGYIIGGGENDFNTGPEQIIKIDSVGNVVWARKYNNGFFDLARLGSNHFIIYDMRDSSVWGTHQFGEISIFNSDGILQTAITIPESLVVSRVHPTADGGTIALGVAEPPNGNGQSMILKTDSSANFEWIKYIDDTLNIFGVGLSDIIGATAGGYIALGTYHYPDTLGAPSYQLVVRLDTLGDTLWTKSISTIGGSRIYNSNEDGFLIIGANCAPAPAITSLDSAGNVKWAIAFPCSEWLNIDDFVMNADGNFVFSATHYNNGISYPGLLKTDTSGTILWMHTYPAPANFNYEHAVMKSNDGGYALLAFNRWTNLFTLIKTDSSGISSCDSMTVLPSHVDPLLQSTPSFHSIHPIFYSLQPYTSTQFSNLVDSLFIQFDNCLVAGTDRVFPDENMLNIFPNPTNDQVGLKSSGFREKSVMEIFNTIGEKIYSAVYHEGSTVNCELFPPGIYFVRLSDSEKQFTQKLMVE